ncbi:MAG: N-6 DNA methylase [Patescibacteria group bacterium]
MSRSKSAMETYIATVVEKAQSNVREESYYGALEQLFASISELINSPTQVDSSPKRTKGGNPDIRVLNDKGRLTGYIEVKDLGRDLDNLTSREDEQMKRYRKELNGNLILTNLMEFRLYREDSKIDQVVIGRSRLIKEVKITPAVENKDVFIKLCEKFFSYSTPRITSPKELAIELAKRTRFLRDEVISQELENGKDKNKNKILGFYKAFQEYLISSLNPQDFADLYAQTITYGLFIARHRYETTPSILEEGSEEQPFNRELEYKFIQPTLGILREVFHFISSAEPPRELKWAVDDIAEVLAAADLKKIVSSFHKEGRGRDPIVHFYETFLAEYDPEERERRGVYYTPEPVVSYITRSIHKLLKEKFGKKDGFADSSVTVLDPAAGTLTFPARAIQLAVEEYRKK